MRITNQDMCKLLGKKYADNEIWKCKLAAPNTISFYSNTHNIDVKTNSNNVETFAKIMHKIDWINAYKNSIPVRIAKNKRFEKRKLCLFNQSKKTEVRFLIPSAIQSVIEEELFKTREKER